MTMLRIFFEGPKQTGKTTLIEDLTEVENILERKGDLDRSKIKFVYDATKNDIVSRFAEKLELGANAVLKEIEDKNPIVTHALRYYEGILDGMQENERERSTLLSLPLSPPIKKRKLETNTIVRLYENELQLEQCLNPYTLFPSLKGYFIDNFISQLIFNSLFLEKGVGIDAHIFFVIYSDCMMQEDKEIGNNNNYIRPSNDLFNLLSKRLMGIETTANNNGKGALGIISVPTHVHIIYVYPKKYVNCRNCFVEIMTMGGGGGGGDRCCRNKGFLIYSTRINDNHIIHLFLCSVAIGSILDIIFPNNNYVQM